MPLLNELKINSGEAPAVVRGRLIRFYSGIGYRQDSGNTASLVFRRGSVLKGWFSFSPRSWKAVVEATITLTPAGESSVLVRYRVDTTGHIITPGEVDFWNAEFNALVDALTTGLVRPADSRRAERAAVRGNWRFLGELLAVLPLGILQLLLEMIPRLVLAYFVMRLFGRLLFRLLPTVGPVALTLISAFLLLGVFAALLLSPLLQLAGQLASRAVNRLPGWSTRLLSFVFVTVLWGVLIGLVLASVDVIRALDTDIQLVVMGGLLAAILAIGLIRDRRDKEDQET